MSGQNPEDPEVPQPTAPAKPPTLGALARLLWEAAGLSRRAFGDQVGLGAPQIKGWETGRLPLTLTTDEWQRLIAHPAMADLPAMAAKAGIAINLAPGYPGNQGDDGSSPGEPRT